MAAELKYPRYYPGILGTPDGRVIAFSGWDVTNHRLQIHEVLTPTYPAGQLPNLGSWQEFPMNEPDYAQLYAHMYVMPDGRYFNAGPYEGETYQSRLYHPYSLQWINYGLIPDLPGGGPDPAYGLPGAYPSSAMIVALDAQGENPRAFAARSGGAVRLDKDQPGNIYYATEKAQILELKADGSNPYWQKLPAGGSNPGLMNQRRVNHQMMALPTREFAVVNGNEFGKYNELLGGLPTGFRKPEIFSFNTWLSNPQTGSWTSYAEPDNPADRITRGYHSAAILLKDGRIAVMGGEPNVLGQRNAQFWSPPYLSIANPPEITSYDATIPLRYGTTRSMTVSLATGRTVKRACLIALPSNSHAIGFNNRYVELKVTGTAGNIVITAPANANLAPPGWYYLFVEDSAGAVAKEAKIIRVSDEFSHCPPTSVLLGPDEQTNAPAQVRSGDNSPFAFTVPAGQTKEITATATVPHPTPWEVKVRLEHRGLGLSYTLEVWKFTTSSWVQVGSGSTTDADDLDEVIFAGSGNYMSGGQMKVRIKYTAGPTQVQATIDEIQVGTRLRQVLPFPPPEANPEGKSSIRQSGR